MDKPNILLIVTDQQRGDCIGIDPASPDCLLTPNIDELAKKGTFFRRGYTECPSCMPARRTLFSGMAPAAHGMVGMTGTRFDVDNKLAALLTRSGYQTECVGKMHLPPAGERHGFEHIRHADATRLDSRYTEFLRSCGVSYTRPGVSHGADPNGWVGRPNHLPETQTHTWWCVNEALDFLSHRDPAAPFFLNVSFIDPHPPLTPPAWYYDRYINQDLPKPVIGDWARNDFSGPDKGQAVASHRVCLDEHAMNCCRAGYYGMINHVDDQVGRLVNYLRDQGLYHDTLIIFTSDHGEMLGDHHRFRKCFAYEASARVPFIIKAPTGWRCNPVETFAPVGLQDIMPTLLDVAGADIPAEVTGHSLLPLVKGETTDGPRQLLHGEHAPQYAPDEGVHFITDGRYKYIWYTITGQEQLFDLDTDPQECTDMALRADAERLIAPWRQKLIAILDGRPEGFTDGTTLITDRPYTHMMTGSAPGKVFPFV